MTNYGRNERTNDGPMLVRPCRLSFFCLFSIFVVGAVLLPCRCLVMIVGVNFFLFCLFI